MKKDAPRNFTKFTGKHLCQGLYFNFCKPKACNFIKREALAQVFSCEFYEVSKDTFFTIDFWTATCDFFTEPKHFFLQNTSGQRLSGQRLALGNQKFPVGSRLLAMCRGEFSAVIARLMSKCR